MKTCNICKTEKDLSEFYKNSYRKDGYDNRCKACQKSYTDRSNKKVENKRKRLKHRQDNQELINRYKRFIGCTQCNKKFHPVQLDLNHRDPETKKNNGKKDYGAVNSNWARETLKEEIRKCDVVCANCHRLITHNLI